METTAAHVVWSMLQDEGVEYVFGVSGITNVPLLHALTQVRGLRFIHAAHEDVSVGMADGYARASGKIGVVVVHSTAGASNTMGNLHNAYAAGTPIVVLAGQSDAPLEWGERYLDVNFRPMVSQVTKGCWMVTRAQDVSIAMNRAIKEAMTPPTGPVFLAMPMNVQSQVVRYEPFPPQGRHVAIDIGPAPDTLRKAVQVLSAAEKPVIFAGHAVADVGAVAELVTLAETLAALVYTGNETKLIFPTNHPLYRGQVPQNCAGMRKVAASADVLLAVGSNLFKHHDRSETPVVPPQTKVIQVDLDAQALARFCPTEIALLANPRAALRALESTVAGAMSSTVRQEKRDALDRLTGTRRQKNASLQACLDKDWKAVPIRWGAALKEIAAALPEGAVVVDELASLYGQLSRIMEFRAPGTYYSCVDHLGWGLPATLGIALGSSPTPVIGVLGDGGSLFAIQALWTAARYQIPAVMVILNNGGYGCMRGLFMMHGKMVGTEMSSDECANYDVGAVNLTKLASDFGLFARRVADPTEIRPALEEAIARQKPVLLEIMISPEGAGMLELMTELAK